MRPAPVAPTISLVHREFGMTPAPKSSEVPHENDPSRCKVVQLGAETVRGERGRTLKLMRDLPEGLAIGERKDGRKKPFFLRAGTDRRVSSYATERERNDTAAALWAKQKEAGVGVLQEFDGELWRRVTDVLKRTGASPEQLERAWQTTEANGGSPLLTSDAVTNYVALRKAEGMKEKTDTYRHVRKHLVERLVGALGHWRLCDVTTDKLRAWGDGLRDDDGKALGDVTKRHHLISAKTFFGRAQREGWILRDPTEAIILPKLVEKDPNIISARDAFEFFKANRDHRAVGRIALEAFGVLRRKSAGKAQEEHLHREVRGIFMPGRDHKSAKRKFRQGQPANLWTWIEHAPAECWDLTSRQYADEKTEMHVNAKLRPMVLKSKEDRAAAERLRNVWRHSCISYLLADTGNTPAVARLAQHSRISTTEGYEGVVFAADARLYLAITPETVLLTWEQFAASVPLSPA